MLQLSEQLLDKVAPQLSRLRPFEIYQIQEKDFDLHKRLLRIAHWEVERSEGTAVLAVLRQMVRRASSAALAYHQVSENLEGLFRSYQADSPNLTLYFDALDAAESCLLNMQMTVEAMNMPKFGGESYVTGPAVESCTRLANSIKHFGERRSKKRSNSSMPIWFVPGGIAGQAGYIGLETLAKMIEGALSEVSYLSRPRFVEGLW